MSAFTEACRKHLDQVGGAMAALPMSLAASRRKGREAHREQGFVTRGATSTSQGCLGCLLVGPIALLIGGSFTLTLYVMVGVFGEMVLLAWALVVVLAWGVGALIDRTMGSRRRTGEGPT